MTKKEREVLQKYFNRIREFKTKGNESFNKLMELNGAEGTGHRWCCASENLRDLLSVKDRREQDHIVCLYDDYVGARAAEDLLMELGAELANLGFWKNS